MRRSRKSTGLAMNELAMFVYFIVITGFFGVLMLMDLSDPWAG